MKRIMLAFSGSIMVVIMSSMLGGCHDPGQYVDLKADVKVDHPYFTSGNGPIVMIDAAHNNFHTADGRYAPFANLLRNDGYQVVSNVKPFSDSILLNADVVIIANAHVDDTDYSFSPAEISALQEYLVHGGSLLLIADHTPFPAAIQELASAFSITWHNVYADDGEEGIFSKKNGNLVEDELTSNIRQVRTFGGSGFTIDSVLFRPVLVLGHKATMQSMSETGLSGKQSAEGWLQGAVMEYGKGRVAVFGEAAMFSAQRYGRMHTRMGFHARGARENKAFILRIMHYLAGN